MNFDQANCAWPKIKKFFMTDKKLKTSIFLFENLHEFHWRSFFFFLIRQFAAIN